MQEHIRDDRERTQGEMGMGSDADEARHRAALDHRSAVAESQAAYIAALVRRYRMSLCLCGVGAGLIGFAIGHSVGGG